MSSLRKADIASGLCCAVFGLCMAEQALKIQNLFNEPLHPNTLPLGLSLILAGLGLLLALRSWRCRGADIDVAWPASGGWFNIIVTTAALSALYLGIPIMGLPVSAALFVSGLIWFYDRKIATALLVGLGVGLLLYFGFIRFLQRPFPLGILS